MTPVSTDPLVSTFFAAEANSMGEGVMHIVPRWKVADKVIEGNVLRGLEAEVGIAMSPTRFAAVAETYSLSAARQTLIDMGFSVPSSIAGKAGLDAALRFSPRLTPSQAGRFVGAIGQY